MVQNLNLVDLLDLDGPVEEPCFTLILVQTLLVVVPLVELMGLKLEHAEEANFA